MNKFKAIYIKLICFFIFLFLLKFPKNYYIFFKCCLKYIQYYHKLDKKCLKCEKEIIFNGLKIFSPEDTLDEIIKKNSSIARFGDGEISLIFGQRLKFQKVNKILITKLKKVLKSKKKGLLIGINIPYNNSFLNKYTKRAKKYYINFVERQKLKIFKL